MITCCYGAKAQQLSNLPAQQRNSSTLSRATSLLRSLHHTQLARAHTHTPSRNPQNEWSARPSGCYRHNTNTRDDISLPSAGFEPAFPAMELPQTYALGLTATGIVCVIAYCSHFRPIDNKSQLVPPRTGR